MTNYEHVKALADFATKGADFDEVWLWYRREAKKPGNFHEPDYRKFYAQFTDTGPLFRKFLVQQARRDDWYNDFKTVALLADPPDEHVDELMGSIAQVGEKYRVNGYICQMALSLFKEYLPGDVITELQARGAEIWPSAFNEVEIGE